MVKPIFTSSTPLPDLDEVSRLWDRHGMLDNIRAHSEVVRFIALLLTDWLDEAGCRLERDAVEVGALLHDIAKTACLGNQRRHDVEGQRILESLGYPELGLLVGWRYMSVGVGYRWLIARGESIDGIYFKTALRY